MISPREMLSRLLHKPVVKNSAAASINHPDVDRTITLMNTVTADLFPHHHWQAFGLTGNISANIRLIRKDKTSATGYGEESEVPHIQFDRLVFACKAVGINAYSYCGETTDMVLSSHKVYNWDHALARIDLVDPDYLERVAGTMRNLLKSSNEPGMRNGR